MIKIKNKDELIEIYNKVLSNTGVNLVLSPFDYIAYDSNSEIFEGYDNIVFDVFTYQYFNPCFIEANNTLLVLGSYQIDMREDIFSSNLVRKVKSVIEKYKDCRVFRYNIIEPAEKIFNPELGVYCMTKRNIADFISQKVDDKIIFIGYINMKEVPNTPEILATPNRTLRSSLGLESEEQIEQFIKELQIALENL